MEERDTTPACLLKIRQWPAGFIWPLVSAAILFLAASGALAADYYVDGTNGNDGNSGSSWPAAGAADADYYSEQGEFTAETFHTIENQLNARCAVGIKYLHGTPSSNGGNHVVTVWGLCKDPRYLPSDPRHYSAVIISDSDDDKRGYAVAEDAPNRVKVWPVTWNDAESVYEIGDGFLVNCCFLRPCR